VGLFLLFRVALYLLGKVPIRYNLRNLTSRWVTTVVTGLAFTMVVGLSVVMVAFVNGMYRLTQQSGQPGNVIVLSDGATDEQFSNLTFTDYTNIENPPAVLKLQRGEKELPLVSKEVYVVVNQILPQPNGAPAKRRFIQTRGIEDGEISGAVHGLKLQSGNWFDAKAGVQENPDGGDNFIQAVIGSGLAGELGNDRPDQQPLRPGDTFPLGEAKGKQGIARQFIVTGVLESAGSTFDSEIWAKLQLMGDMFGKTNPTTVVVRSKNLKSAKALAEEYKELKDPVVNAQPEVEYFAKLGDTSKQFLYAIIAMASVMSLGGIFGVMNTMFAAITQRSKDIGVLRIVGFKRRQIVVSFLLESLMLALLGGILGCAVGMLADGWTAKSIVSSGQGGGKFVVLKLAVTSEVLSLGLLISLCMGLVGGLVPALGAMRLRALDSLR